MSRRRAPHVLTARALNRALLARQLLLRRSRLGTLETVEHLVGIQAQVPLSPYIALWSRLSGFQPEHLTRLIEARRVVRLALMRSTIHMVSARDCARLRPVLQPVLDRSMKGTFGRRLAGLDLDEVVAAARGFLDERPRTLAELGGLLRTRWAARDAEALAHAVRALVPLVQIPPRGIWGAHGPAVHAAGETWLRRRAVGKPSLDRTIRRYLGAFGPASVQDVQAWCGLTRLDEALERLRPTLRVFADERGVELFDVDGAPRPRPDVDAPPRFLPEFDNVLLGHRDRSRVFCHPPTDTEGSGSWLSGTVLVDGFAAARWHVRRIGTRAVLAIDAFRRLSASERASVEDEGHRLLTFAAGDAARHDVRF